MEDNSVAAEMSLHRNPDKIWGNKKPVNKYPIDKYKPQAEKAEPVQKKFSYMTATKPVSKPVSKPALKPKVVKQPRSFASEQGLTSGFKKSGSSFDHNHGQLPTGQNYNQANSLPPPSFS